MKTPPPKAERKGVEKISSPLPARKLPPPPEPIAKPPDPPKPLDAKPVMAPIQVKPADTKTTDGVMAKAPSGVYEANKRVMLKVKHDRECDCVVAGFRWHKGGDHDAVGSLLLGLYDAAGNLQHVGVCASFTMQKRRELVQFLAPYRERALDQHPWRSWADASTGADGAQRMFFRLATCSTLRSLIRTRSMGGLLRRWLTK